MQKSKEEKKKKKHKHEDKGEDLLGGQAEEPVQSEETNEVAAVPTSTSAEVRLWRFQPGLYLRSDLSRNFYKIILKCMINFSVLFYAVHKFR